MIRAFARAFAQLGDPKILRILVISVALSALVFVALAIGIDLLLTWQWLHDLPAVARIVQALGTIATLVAAFFLFPVVVSVMLGLFLESVAEAVEERYYPGLPPPRGVGLLAGIWASVLFLGKALLVNLVLLVFLLVPALYPLVWLFVNAYLIGREYFELVALRRLPLGEARRLRRQHRLAAMLGGLGGILLFMLPVINLLAPVLLTMVMVHACQRWLRSLAF